MNRLNFSLVLLIFLAAVHVHAEFNSTRVISTWIESPKVTGFGVWGEADVCPEGTFVYGFRLKNQLDQGIFADDTALNAVELSCIDRVSKRIHTTGNGEVNARAYVISLEGSFGAWGTYFECDDGRFATGFELRSEAPTIDNTAANNFALYCEDDAAGTRLEGNGHSWGDWSGRVDCPRGMEICGIKAQVEAIKPPPGDNTSLNNVDLACCETTTQTPPPTSQAPTTAPPTTTAAPTT